MTFKEQLEIAKNTDGRVFVRDYNVQNGMYYMLFNNDTPVDVFLSMRGNVNKAGIGGASGFYVEDVIKHRTDGSILPKKEWGKRLMYHKAWQSNDSQVKAVKYKIAGYKGQTTQLPPAVLISSIEFILD